MREVNYAEKIQLSRPPPFFYGRRQKTLRRRPASIGHTNVNATEPLCRFADKRFYGVWIANIHRLRQHLYLVFLVNLFGCRSDACLVS